MSAHGTTFLRLAIDLAAAAVLVYAIFLPLKGCASPAIDAVNVV